MQTESFISYCCWEWTLHVHRSITVESNEDDTMKGSVRSMCGSKVESQRHGRMSGEDEKTGQGELKLALWSYDSSETTAHSCKSRPRGVWNSSFKLQSTVPTVSCVTLINSPLDMLAVSLDDGPVTEASKKGLDDRGFPLNPGKCDDITAKPLPPRTITCLKSQQDGRFDTTN